MNDGKPGLRIESAASVIARDFFHKYLGTFAHVIREDRVCNASTAASFVDGLAGVVSLTIAGGHGSRTDVIEAVIKSLREAVDRDLRHLANGR